MEQGTIPHHTDARHSVIFFSRFICLINEFIVSLPTNKRIKMNKATVISSIKEIAGKTLPANSTLLLYGSRARGDNRPDSDWDLLILLDKPSLSFKDYDYGYPFSELGWEINEEINAQVYSKKEWNDYHYTPFYKNVEHDKIVLV